MAEFLIKVFQIPFWSKFADFHGFLAMTSLILFGAALVLYFLYNRHTDILKWLKTVSLLLFINILTLEIAGMAIYVPYRAEGGPRSILKSSEELAWLHNTVFEHKEFLAFAPLVLTLTAFLIIRKLGDNFGENRYLWLRKSVLVSFLLALIFVLIIAAEAVLVTKAAPV